MGHKKGLLVGCNYPGTKAELKGCANDVWRMRQCLLDRYGFRECDVAVLVHTDPSRRQPTGANIRRAIADLVASARPGDSLFFHYSGHGTRLPAETGNQDDTGYDECIVPCDMNLITGDDFREFVDKVPDGCRITIVSDSCHSGGLLDKSKEQIGDSTRQPHDNAGASDSGFSFSSFVKQQVRDAIEPPGFNLPQESNHHHHHRHEDEEGRDEGQHYGVRRDVRSRSLPLSTLIEILQQKTGREDIDVGKIRPTLFDMFGEDVSPKIKKFMKVLLDRFQSCREGRGGGLVGIVGTLAHQFLKQKLDENDEGYAQPALATHVHSMKEVHVGTKQLALPDNGILISGYQTDQTSADASSPQGAYGALSNAIQTILAEHDGDLSNRELVLKARQMLAKQGFSQRPGLYCSDEHVDHPFVC